MIELNSILASENDKINYLKAIIRVAKCDSVVTDEEKQYLVAAASLIGLSEEYYKDINSFWYSTDMKLHFSSPKAAAVTVLQLIQLCWIDGDYSKVEADEISVIAEELGVNRDRVDLMEAWVKEGIEWTNRGDSLIEF